jgi:hypothetical protein
MHCRRFSFPPIHPAIRQSAKVQGMKRDLILLWLAWFLRLYSFQWLVTSRLQVQRPGTAVFWSANETLPTSNQGKIYLNDPFMNRQVAWDSEYYLGIAVGGYDDPNAGSVRNPATGREVIKNYSFFPSTLCLFAHWGFR